MQNPNRKYVKSTKIRNYNRVLLKDTIKNCIFCLNTFTPKKHKQIYCSRNCALNHTHQLIKTGIIKTNSNNRGKGEIYFSELCINYFGKDDVLCNEKIFKDKNGGLWDADIIIKSLKLAILYDGIFHFIQVKKNMNLSQIQSRDKLKRKIIQSNGYKYYTIKDLGKFNKQFVDNEFNLFIHKQSFNNVISDFHLFIHRKKFNNVILNLKNVLI